MRTTVIIEDVLYQKLVNESIHRYGSAKRLSQTLNELLSKHFSSQAIPDSLFGTVKKMNLSDLRDEREPHESD